MPKLLPNREDFCSLCRDTNLRGQSQSELTFSCSADQKAQVTMVLSPVQSKLNVSARATTSSWPAVKSHPAQVLQPFSGDFVSSLYIQSVVIDSLVDVQMEHHKSGMKILRKKHQRDVLSAVQQQAVKRLRVKEVELESARQRNRELEEQVMQMTGDIKTWFNYAKTTESVVSDLRVKLYDIMTNQNICRAVDVEEGYGDSGGESELVCEQDEKTHLIGRMICKVCLGTEVCMLLLPCRYLYLCKDCLARIDACPVCNSTKTASIEVVV